ncbi:hypothetical protein [cf. Phormidesmis sp. LEGE 11477]|uniref:hypothetical protein n=1 Tax=cf. Phormidesmis sp. LEGE 11477 TaxID=1828680 RepID=UPI0018813953|nr:hypothetical protein [cf. Phormidesmis sp. LEGE 11477]MBE9063530.1 hypothetical protein [cf. Phormidesmis sp. LEGE 11477]
MFTLSTQGDQSPTVSPAIAPTTATETAPPSAPPTAPVTYTEPVRLMLFGSLSAVQTTIKQIHLHGYAEPNDWSQPISTGRPNEVMAILTKRVSVG